jgi:uncharacterized membrane protein YeiH
VVAVLEVIGIFAFATSGALLAVRRGFDIVGILTLAILTSVGGGVLRDLCIGDTPPAAFVEWPFYVAPLAASGITFLFHPTLERLTRAILVLDAAGLGLFCLAGTVKALDYGLDPLPAAALGVTTGVGGGLLRDVVARETPVLMHADSTLYAVPAAAGCLVIALAWELDRYTPALGTAAATGIVVVRLLALRRGWRAPTARALIR